MEIKAIKTVYYSPTGTTRKIIRALGEALSTGQDIEEIDLTTNDNTSEIIAGSDDLVIVGIPVYAGRVAPLAIKRLDSLRGRQTPVVLVALYGNREFEDALVELGDELTARSFTVIAGCAFIGEHSYSTEDKPIAKGRPDSQDIAVAREFGGKILEKLLKGSSATIKPPHLPGNIPYRDGIQNFPFGPVIDSTLCTMCGECIPVCPAGALSMETDLELDIEKCTFCCGCLKSCPERAIRNEAAPLLEVADRLYTNCRARKEPELFL